MRKMAAKKCRVGGVEEETAPVMAPQETHVIIILCKCYSASIVVRYCGEGIVIVVKRVVVNVRLSMVGALSSQLKRPFIKKEFCIYQRSSASLCLF